MKYHTKKVKRSRKNRTIRNRIGGDSTTKHYKLNQERIQVADKLWSRLSSEFKMSPREISGHIHRNLVKYNEKRASSDDKMFMERVRLVVIKNHEWKGITKQQLDVTVVPSTISRIMRILLIDDYGQMVRKQHKAPLPGPPQVKKDPIKTPPDAMKITEEYFGDRDNIVRESKQHGKRAQEMLDQYNAGTEPRDFLVELTDIDDKLSKLKKNAERHTQATKTHVMDAIKHAAYTREMFQVGMDLMENIISIQDQIKYDDTTTTAQLRNIYSENGGKLVNMRNLLSSQTNSGIRNNKIILDAIDETIRMLNKVNDAQMIRRRREEIERAAAIDANRAARERAEREEAERVAREIAEREEAERVARERAEREEAERVAHERAEREEAERVAREKAEQEKAEWIEREKAAREEAERIAREQEEIRKLEQEEKQTRHLMQMIAASEKMRESKRLYDEQQALRTAMVPIEVEDIPVDQEEPILQIEDQKEEQEPEAQMVVRVPQEEPESVMQMVVRVPQEVSDELVVPDIVKNGAEQAITLYNEVAETTSAIIPEQDIEPKNKIARKFKKSETPPDRHILKESSNNDLIVITEYSEEKQSRDKFSDSAYVRLKRGRGWWDVDVIEKGGKYNIKTALKLPFGRKKNSKSDISQKTVAMGLNQEDAEKQVSQLILEKLNDGYIPSMSERKIGKYASMTRKQRNRKGVYDSGEYVPHETRRGRTVKNAKQYANMVKKMYDDRNK